MRPFALALTLVVSGAAVAQTQTEPTYEQVINQAFANLHQQRDVVLTLNGTETEGTRTVPIETTVVWHQVGDAQNRTLKLAIRRRVNGVMTMEVRASGDALYTYDYINKTYSAMRYHAPADPTQPSIRAENYLSRLLAATSRATTSNGPDSFAARLLGEAMGNPAAVVTGDPVHYRRWFPSREPVRLEDRTDLQEPGVNTFRDPVVPKQTRLYVTDTEEKYRYFLYDLAPRRSLVFVVHDPDRSDPTDNTLSTIYYGELNRTASKDRRLEWTMSVQIPVVPESSTDYETQFAPYKDMRGWRPVTPRS